MSRKLIVPETAISFVINSALTLGFSLLAFGGKAEASVWGVGGLRLDSFGNPAGWYSGRRI